MNNKNCSFIFQYQHITWWPANFDRTAVPWNIEGVFNSYWKVTIGGGSNPRQSFWGLTIDV